MPAAALLADAASAGAAAKQVDLDIQAYQKARNVFVNAIREHLSKQDGGVTLDALIRNDIVALLCCPLTSDPIQGIQIEALQNVGKVGKATAAAASAVASSGVLGSIVLAQGHTNPRVQEAANKSLCSLSEESKVSAERLLQTDTLAKIKQQLDGTDPAVKQTGLATVASLASASAELADAVVDEPLLDAIAQLLRAPELPPDLHTAACQALANAASHTLELAERIRASGCIVPIIAILNNKRVRSHRLRATALQCLAHLAKHPPPTRNAKSVASAIVAAGAISPVLRFAVDAVNSDVRHAAAAVVLQLSCRTPSLTEAIASEGCSTALVCSLKLDHGTSFALPAISALGYIASFAPAFADAVISAGAVPELITAMSNTHIDVHTAAAWAIESMAAHGGPISTALADAGVLPPLLKLYTRSKSESDARVAAKRAMKEVMRHTRHQAPLRTLVAEGVPPELQRHALTQMFTIMQGSVTDRREYVTSGALMTMQRLEAGLDPKGKQSVKDINSLFPADVVNYYRGIPS